MAYVFMLPPGVNILFDEMMLCQLLCYIMLMPRATPCYVRRERVIVAMAYYFIADAVLDIFMPLLDRRRCRYAYARRCCCRREPDITPSCRLITPLLPLYKAGGSAYCLLPMMLTLPPRYARCFRARGFRHVAFTRYAHYDYPRHGATPIRYYANIAAMPPCRYLCRFSPRRYLRLRQRAIRLLILPPLRRLLLPPYAACR